MKVPLSWLRDYIDITLPPREIAERLTMAGIEVGNIVVIGDAWDNIVIAEIIGIDAHPNADRLRLTTLNLGESQITVVCGAPNLVLGDKVPFAQIGARVFDAHTDKFIDIKKVKIRGIASQGMICSERELGISDNHEGIMILPADVVLGAPLKEYLGETVFDLEITPNRPDCLSLIGIAREVAALTGADVRLPQISYRESGSDISKSISVEIADPDLCHRYCASLITGVKVMPSPLWMQQRLLAYGMQPINNIVDATNYVMLEYGQPLHAFDYEQIGGQKIVVRRAQDGEVITALDDTKRTLNQDMLAITNGNTPIAIAGIMGGLESGISENTTSVLLEAASFNQANIRRTASQLMLRSEASIRFERGIAPDMTLPALMRVTKLIVEIAGGEAARGIIDIYPGKIEKVPILLSASDTEYLLGIEFDIDQIKKILVSLGFECKPVDSLPQLWVIPPYWRNDVSCVADLVEEVARIAGYDNIPPTMLSSSLPRQQPDVSLIFRETVRDILVGCGMQEVIGHSLTSMEMLQRISSQSHLIGPKPIHIANPITTTQEYLRTSLRPELFAILSSNQKHEDGGLRLFDIGKIYLSRGNQSPEERTMLDAVFSGPRIDYSWTSNCELIDFFDVKGVAESLFNRLGINVDFRIGKDESLHPGKTAEIIAAGKVKIGVLGEINPRVASAFNLQSTSYLLEIDMEELQQKVTVHRYHPLNRYPRVIRDIAVLVDTKLPAQKIVDIIESFPLVTKANLFDLYTGKQIPKGKKSLAYRIIYQSPNHTLTDEEVDEVQQQIIKDLHDKLKATLRE